MLNIITNLEGPPNLPLRKMAVIGWASANLTHMENQIYRLQLTDESRLEFYVCSTNEVNPHRNIKELGVCVLGKVIQLDGDLNLSELDSLISYLQDCREYIKEYNENSKPSGVVS